MVKFMKVWDKLGTVFLIVFEIILFSIIAPGFLSVETFTNILRQSCILGVAALGYGMLRFMGLTNLSTGSIIGLAGIIGCRIMLAGGSPAVAVVAIIVIAAMLSVFDGILGQLLRMSTFIITLATMSLWRGFCFALTGGKTIYGMPDKFSIIGQGTLFGFLPSLVLILIVCFVVAYIFLNKVYLGRHIYGVGGNEAAAYLSGINVKKTQLLTHLIAGVFFGIASVMLLSRNMVAIGGMGSGYEFSCLTAVVLGGVGLAGGQGKIQNVLLGVLVLGIMSTGLQMVAIQTWTETLIKGLLLFFSLFMDGLRQKANHKLLLQSN